MNIQHPCDGGNPCDVRKGIFMQFIEFPKIDVKIEGMEDVRIPKMFRIKQIYDDSRITDIPRHIREQMERNLSNRERFRGKRLCVTAGSRGIPEIDTIIGAVVDILKQWGAEPFIVPAMGSHGGATAEGQKELLASYNITEESIGAPILSSMDVIQIGELPDGTPLFCDKYAAKSDGIVILNKVSWSTTFATLNYS